MPLYEFTAIDSRGKVIKSTLEAESEALVLSRLRDQTLVCTDIHTTTKPPQRFGRGKVKAKSLVVFSRQFATMVDAGIPLLRALDILVAQCKDDVLRAALDQICLDVRSGLTLNEAMAKHPRVFNRLYVNMVKAAEISGILHTILDRLSSFLEYEAEVKAKIKSALMYPVLVLIFSQIMLFCLFSFVLPKFKDIFTGMNAEMPPVTAALFAFGDFMNHSWWMILLGLAGAYFGVRKWSSTDRGRYQLDFIKLKVPVIGDLVLKLAVARFCRTLGTLVNSGVPMLRGLEIIGDTLGNRVLTQAVEETRVGLREGKRLAVPLEASGLFPTMVTTMIDIGEESGRLSDMLVKVGDFYDAEVETAVKGLTSLIEPALIVFLGGVVGFIAISIMTPIFKLVNSVK